jgi:hypothetical protein
MEPNHIQNKQDLIDAINRVIADLSQFTVDDDYEVSLNKYNRNDIETILNNTDIKDVVCDVTSNPEKLFEKHNNLERSKTQLSADFCENFIASAFSRNFQEHDNLPHHAKIKLMLQEQTLIAPKNDFTGFDTSKKYMFIQPFGTQMPPDILLVYFDDSNMYLCPIEVKQGLTAPTWNNNPPKANFAYFFIRRRDKNIYFHTGKNIRGENILRDDAVKKFHTTVCKSLERNVYDDDHTRIISYKKIESKHFPKENYYRV